MGLIIAVDVGASKLRVALFDEKSRMLSKAVTPTPKEGDELAIPNAILSLATSLAPPSELKRAAGIGVGSIGPLDIKRGAIVNSPNIPFKRVPLVDALSEALDVPVCLLNDCAAAAWGEKNYGAGKGVENLVYLTFSSGIGCGAVVDGRLLFGKDGNAHEVGHFVIDAEGKLECGCGRRGHWEAYCSGTGIPKLARLLISEAPQDLLAKSELPALAASGRLDAESVLSAARRGDGLAVSIVSEIVRLNAIGLANVVNAYDPSLITVGGGVALNAFDLVIGPAAERLAEYAVNALPKVILTPLKEDAVLYGAAAAVINPPTS